MAHFFVNQTSQCMPHFHFSYAGRSPAHAIVHSVSCFTLLFVCVLHSLVVLLDPCVHLARTVHTFG